MAYQSINPYTGETLASYQELTDEQLEAKLAKAYETYQSWRTTSFSERTRLLNSAIALFKERRSELAKINTVETGKLFMEAAWEIDVVVAIFDYYARNAEQLLQPKIYKSEDPTFGDAVCLYQPQGIVYEVEPWNVPFFQMARPMAAQIMAGNTVVLKHAHNVPQCALAMEKLMLDAGAPEGLFTNMFISYDQSAKVIADPRVCGVTITGSTSAGKLVGEEAGTAVKKVVLELGGCDPMMVLEDADLQTAINGAMLGRMTLSGQACTGDKRMIVHESLYDAFKQGVTDAINALVPGDPLLPDTTLAPVCSVQAAEKVRQQIATAVAHGAKAETVGKPVPADIKSFVQPTILTNVLPDNPLFGEEIFGPVLTLYSYSDEAEAIKLANNTPYGLAASVYSKDAKHAFSVAQQIEAGMITINQPSMPTPSVPFGGTKESGHGRELGREGIIEFTSQKFVNSGSFDLTKQI